MSLQRKDLKGASNIKLLREKLGWSQTKLARELMTDNNHISAWERGARRPDYDSCLKLIEIAALNNIKVDAKFIRPDKKW